MSSSTTFSRLFADTSAVGSMNTVSPVRDVSWTIPSPSDFAEALSGNTKRSARTVKNWSCKTETYSSDRISFSIAPRAFSASALRSSRNRASSGEAASLISPEASKVAEIVRANPRGGSSSAANVATSGVAGRDPTPGVPTNARRASSAISVSTATGRSSSAPSTIPFSAEERAASISGAASEGSDSPARSNPASSATAAICSVASLALPASESSRQSARPAADCASAARRLSSSAQSRTSRKRVSAMVRARKTTLRERAGRRLKTAVYGLSMVMIRSQGKLNLMSTVLGLLS
jgi:hypothetical protein